MYWTIKFNDGSVCTVKAGWIVEAIFEACIDLGKNYHEVLKASLAHEF